MRQRVTVKPHEYICKKEPLSNHKNINAKMNLCQTTSISMQQRITVKPLEYLCDKESLSNHLNTYTTKNILFEGNRPFQPNISCRKK